MEVEFLDFVLSVLEESWCNYKVSYTPAPNLRNMCFSWLIYSADSANVNFLCSFWSILEYFQIYLISVNNTKCSGRGWEHRNTLFYISVLIKCIFRTGCSSWSCSPWSWRTGLLRSGVQWWARSSRQTSSLADICEGKN